MTAALFVLAVSPAGAGGAAPHATPADPVAAFLVERGANGLWLERSGAPRPAARMLLTRLEAAVDEGLDPERFDAPALHRAVREARRGPVARARAEAALSGAFLAYVQALTTPAPANAMLVVDPSADRARPEPATLLRAVADAPDPAAAVEAATRMHPLYTALRDAYAAERRRSDADPELLRLARLNLDRARALPPPAGRHVLADVAAATVAVWDGARPAVSMRAIVGEPKHPTPPLAGAIRYAIFQPYWNVPEDLAQSRVAPAVLRSGPAYLRAKRMEVLSDWTDAARPIDPAGVDWRLAARRELSVRVRQKPGPDNMMGAVKFMLPNDLGIFLHDTPEKALFARTDRALSAGCVRVERPDALTEALFDGRAPIVPAGAAEYAVDLPKPVPVYLVYLTVAPGPDGRLLRRPDVYGRDEAGWRALQDSNLRPSA